MVSFIEIINKLMDGDYAIATGSPDAPSKMKEFIEDVTSRIRELRGKEEWEIEDIVTDAIDWALEKICKPIIANERRTYEWEEAIGLYECFHPETGRFYVVTQEETDAPSGYSFFGFRLTRSKKEARELYDFIEKEWKEEF